MTRRPNPESSTSANSTGRAGVLGCGITGFIFIAFVYWLLIPPEYKPGSGLSSVLRMIHVDIDRYAAENNRYPTSLQELEEEYPDRIYKDPLRGYQVPWINRTRIYWAAVIVLGILTAAMLPKCDGSFIAMMFILGLVAGLFYLALSYPIHQPNKKPPRNDPDFVFLPPLMPYSPPLVCTVPGAHAPYGDYFLLPDGSLICNGTWAPVNPPRHD